MQRRIFWYEFLLLWGIALVGTMLELLLTRFPAEALANQLYIPFHLQSAVGVSIALTAQVGLQLAVATGVGLWAAHQVGLGAPVLEAWLQNKPVRQLLRHLVLPVVLTALLVSVFSNLPDLSAFHPNRRQRTAELTAFLQTAEGMKLQEQIGKLEPPPRRLTFFSQTLFYTESAVAGGIYDQLFMVSVFIMLLIQTRRMRGSGPDTKLLWGAILIVSAIRAINPVVRQSSPSQIDQIMLAAFPTHRDSLSLVAVRDLLRMVPSGGVLGWLYVRYGIEAAILASFLGAVLGYLLMIHLFVYFA
jgi:hypothetical protein